MRALILSAGLGTRLHPLTLVRAKAAVPVNGAPIARRVISWLVAQGLTDLVLNLHHRPSSIASVVGDGSDLGASVRYSWENPVLGSGGGPRHALPLLVDGGPHATGAGSSFVLVNGDTLTQFSIGAMLAVHQASGASVTMALIPNPRPELYGGVVVQDGCVAGFTRRGTIATNFHFIGVQIAEAQAFARLEDGVAAESVMQLYPQLIKENPRAVAAHIVDAPFSDIGTPADYLQTALQLADAEGDRLVSTVNVRIDPSAAVARTAVWDDVDVGAGAVLEDCIVCDGARIPAGARYKRCAIVPDPGEGRREGDRVDGLLLVRPF